MGIIISILLGILAVWLAVFVIAILLSISFMDYLKAFLSISILIGFIYMV